MAQVNLSQLDNLAHVPPHRLDGHGAATGLHGVDAATALRAAEQAKAEQEATTQRELDRLAAAAAEEEGGDA